MKYLQMLDHPNVVKLVNIIHSRPNLNPLTNIPIGNLYLIFEFVDHDLQGLMNSPQIKYDLTHIKCIFKQLLTGL